MPFARIPTLARTLARPLAAAVVATLLASRAAGAAPVTFDFTSLGSDGTLLGSEATVNGIRASGYTLGLAYAGRAKLWLSDRAGDHGLGVCSEGPAACLAGSGDAGEIDDRGSFEGILLENTLGGQWTSLVLSSLDGRGTGTVLWGDSLLGLLTGGGHTFSLGAFGASAEADVMSLVGSSIDRSARYLAVIAGPSLWGDGNDFLVWKGAVEVPGPVDVPEPATLALLGLGLAGLARLRRRG
ncbi:PEP-CTERM sorting domain-containing protein [Arenibaculum pallidiluteum]|uniref:PEP-CTERM sorting domain-containing protein n=1 Tax=Arenibaculum pallidiluteum TaxID=2812559 RepID=UPI0022A6DB1F|nr:PEP-CTERM sorting domain-containing protein [Arenibaculum pallidiluteum]